MVRFCLAIRFQLLQVKPLQETSSLERAILPLLVTQTFGMALSLTLRQFMSRELLQLWSPQLPILLSIPAKQLNKKFHITSYPHMDRILFKSLQRQLVIPLL